MYNFFAYATITWAYNVWICMMMSLILLQSFILYRSTIHLYQYLTILIENWILSNEINSYMYYIINHLKQLRAPNPNPVHAIINLVAIKFILY